MLIAQTLEGSSVVRRGFLLQICGLALGVGLGWGRGGVLVAPPFHGLIASLEFRPHCPQDDRILMYRRPTVLRLCGAWLSFAVFDRISFGLVCFVCAFVDSLFEFVSGCGLSVVSFDGLSVCRFIDLSGSQACLALELFPK